MATKTKEHVTEWIPASVKPTRPGWYERQYGITAFERLRDWWDGEQFLCDDPAGCVARLELPWRGLASDPKAVQP